MENWRKKMGQRFDNWDEVNCNECANYWTNSCDGVPEGRRKPCSSFLAQRSVTIPLEIKSLREDVKRLKTSNWLILIIVVLSFIVERMI